MWTVEFLDLLASDVLDCILIYIYIYILVIFTEIGISKKIVYSLWLKHLDLIFIENVLWNLVW